MRTASLNTGILTALHLTVDGLCACSVFMWAASIGISQALTLFVLYNVLAFMTQPLVGLWVDRTARRQLVFTTGITLLLIGACLSAFLTPKGNETAAILTMIPIGMGNALFHVFGGKSVAVRSHNDMRHLGVFVSSGAVGLVVGEHFASVLLMAIISAIMVTLSLALIKQNGPQKQLVNYDDGKSIAKHANKAGTPLGKGAVGLLLFILFIVFTRSLIGRMAPAGNMDAVLFAALMGVVAFLGKSMGGFLGHRWGAWPVLCGTLLLSALCFLLCPLHGAFSIAMVLCINLTMPLTLYLANRQLPHREGFAFGLLASVLPIGLVLGNYCASSLLGHTLLFALVATMLIEACVLLAVREYRWQVLGMSMVMNVLTNVPLNLLVISHPSLYALPMQLALECGVVVIESLLFYTVVRSKRQALAYALLCNAVSYLLGHLFTLLV